MQAGNAPSKRPTRECPYPVIAGAGQATNGGLLHYPLSWMMA
jgi:hypothetical protein